MSQSGKSGTDKVSAMNAVITEQITADPCLPRAGPTTSLWQLPRHPRVSSIQSPQLLDESDYVVIGSGIAGCGAVKTLLESPASGRSAVTLLEARTLCSGATGRNGGQLTRVPPTLYPYMSEQFGTEQAKKVMKFTARGLDEMRALAASQGPEIEEFVKHQRLEKIFICYDKQSWDETVEAVALFEKENPEEKGTYTLVSPEECDKVS